MVLVTYIHNCKLYKLLFIYCQWSYNMENRTGICDQLPEKPQEPSPEGCCGTGCQPCVFDIYEQELKLWKEECEKICLGPQSTDNQDECILSPGEYHEFEIINVTLDSENCFIYKFSVPGRRSLGLKTGQHIVLRWKNGSHTLTRQYTPVSDVDDRGFFDVLIKIYETGKMSQYVKSWKVGDKIEWRGPFGKFEYIPNKYHHVIMVAAGTGIAPMAQVIRTILNNEDDETRIHLIFCCKTYSQLLLKKQLDQWSDFWNFSVTYFLSQETSGKPVGRYGDKIYFNRLTSAALSDILDDITESTQVLICGTRSFEKDLVNFIKRMGVCDENYFRF